jgi:Asp/Glu/hydantoin racemase
MTTIETRTAKIITTLRAEAVQFGDTEMTDICDRALAGSAPDVAECVNVVNGASTVTHWTSEDGQADIEVSGTEAEAREELLGQCANDVERAAILAGSFE